MKNTGEYKKYKDNKPEDTVNMLQNILHHAGIDTTYFWTNNEELECYSNRVGITGTSIGSNGKGTSRVYALASGYAELMERLQNGAAYTGALDPSLLEETGMVTAPDEKFVEAEALIQEGGTLLDAFFRVNSCEGELDKRLCLKKWAGNHPIEGKGDDTLLTVPFASLKHHKIIYLPSIIYTKMYGTNGMCAGNTREEALVQGLSEIFERAANGSLLNDPVTPPDVPEHYLKKYPVLWDRIRKIEADGRYKVIVKDCSLKKGYPVLGTIIGDQKKGSFGFRMASHYSFPVALERTLTEALQGRDLDNFTGSCGIAQESVCTNKENIANVFKCGVGSYRKELFYNEPSYEFTPWEEKQFSNGSMLKNMLKLLLDQGYDVLIRDVSFLGFPSYQILVPEFSEIYPADNFKIKEINTVKKISERLSVLHEGRREDIERIRRLLIFKQNAIFETNLAGMFKRPFNRKSPGSDYQDLFLLTACNYRLGMFKEAADSIELLVSRAIAKRDEDRIYYRTVGLLIQLKLEETPDERIIEVLKNTGKPELAERVVNEWMDPDRIFSKLYPRFHCWDCANCSAAYLCEYEKTKEILKNLRKIYRKNIPDQDKLFEIL